MLTLQLYGRRGAPTRPKVAVNAVPTGVASLVPDADGVRARFGAGQRLFCFSLTASLLTFVCQVRHFTSTLTHPQPTAQITQRSSRCFQGEDRQTAARAHSHTQTQTHTFTQHALTHTRVHARIRLLCMPSNKIRIY